MSNDKGIILVTIPRERYGAAEAEKIEKEAAGRKVIHTENRAEMEKYLDATEILIGFGPWDLAAKMPRLKWFQSCSAGVDGLMANPALKDHPVMITNTSGMHREQISEHIFAMILARNRAFPKVFSGQKRREWLRVEDRELPVLSGKTMLILGYGEIGEQTAVAARAFGMKVKGIRRRPAPPDSAVQIETMDKLPLLLGEADYVVNILPFTRETKGLLGAKEFGMMKKGAVYVNVGRGVTNDEEALAAALKDGRLSAALLDVTAAEPLPPESPLWDMENVIITPHYAGARADYASIAIDIAVENLKLYKRGEKLLHLVDKNAGY